MSTKQKTKPEEAITKAVRYLEIPEDVTVPPRCGFMRVVDGKEVDGGPMTFALWFTKLLLPRMKRKTKADMEIESTALRLFAKCKARAKLEVPQEVFAALVDAFPQELAGGNFELYMAQRPHWLALISAPDEQPEGWAKAG